MPTSRRGGPWTTALLVTTLVMMVMLWTGAPSSASTDWFLSGGGTVCTASDFTNPGNACDGSDATAATYAHNHACTSFNDTYAPIAYFDMAAAHKITYLRIKFDVPCGTSGGQQFAIASVGSTCGATVPYSNGTAQDVVVALSGAGCGVTAVTRIQLRVWNDGNGASTTHLWSVEGYTEYPAVATVTAGPAIAAVYTCRLGVSPCDDTTAVGNRGWSVIGHGLVLTVVLRDTPDLNPCEVRLSQVDGPGVVDLGDLGPYSFQTEDTFTAIVDFDGSGDPIVAGPYMVTCSDPVDPDPTKVARWPISLAATGDAFGAAAGAAYDPTADSGSIPLADVFRVFTDARDALLAKPPFSLVTASVATVQAVLISVQADVAASATGRHGSTTCAGYTMVMPTTPPVHYPTGPSATATASAWPSAMPMPSFTILRCSDFETIVSGWSWWSGLRTVIDAGLFAGYGLMWVRRLQPRPVASA